MLCPMRFSGRILDRGDCLEEDCAWWDETVGRCAMFVIANSLKRLADEKCSELGRKEYRPKKENKESS